MLQYLHIRNYAIIEELKIEFSAGLNIITGETGAGKSIIMGALGLILGERTDTGVLLDKELKCFVEGQFSSNNDSIVSYLKENDLYDNGSDILIRREIAPNNKSRAFVNDTPVPLNVLKKLSSLLVDLHQQFDTLELGESDFQRAVIDALAGNEKLLLNYKEIYKKYLSVNRELEKLVALQTGSNKELDYKRFLFDELDEASFTDNEIENIQAELKVIENSENIKSGLSKVYGILEDGEQPVVQILKSLTNQLNAISAFHSLLPNLSDRLHSAQIELQDIADEVDRINGQVSFDEEKVLRLNERLSTGFKLLKKHGLATTSELLELKEELSKELDNVIHLGEKIGQRQKESALLLDEAKKIADKISVNRKNISQPFQKKVDGLLEKVGMPNARIKINIATLPQLAENGGDNIEFLFDANKGNRFEPLKKVASGGELSRLMLSIKSLVARSIQLPTLIFDEIDTGISGEAAKQVGIIMKDLSTGHQIVAITHQPQIAARAASHYYIYKELKKDKIVTQVKLLNQEERINTIATMLSGEKPTAAAFENAKEMIAG